MNTKLEGGLKRNKMFCIFSTLHRASRLPKTFLPVNKGPTKEPIILTGDTINNLDDMMKNISNIIKK